MIQSACAGAQADIDALIADGVRVRLCKGAYKEPARSRSPTKAEVDASYVA